MLPLLTTNSERRPTHAKATAQNMMSIQLINNGRKKHGSVLIFLLFFATDSDIRSHILRLGRTERGRKDFAEKKEVRRELPPDFADPLLFLACQGPSSSSFFPPSGRPGRRRAEGGATKRRRRVKLKPLFSSWPRLKSWQSCNGERGEGEGRWQGGNFLN